MLSSIHHHHPIAISKGQSLNEVRQLLMKSKLIKRMKAGIIVGAQLVNFFVVITKLMNLGAWYMLYKFSYFVTKLLLKQIFIFFTPI